MLWNNGPNEGKLDTVLDPRSFLWEPLSGKRSQKKVQLPECEITPIFHIDFHRPGAASLQINPSLTWIGTS